MSNSKKKIAAIFAAAVMLIAGTAAACTVEEDTPSGENSESVALSWSTAHWIWPDDTTVKTSQWLDYRRDFTLSESPETSEVRIACDTKYFLYVNGTQVVYDGELKRASMSYTYYDVVDIGGYLREGANSICVLVWYWGGDTAATTSNQSKHYLPSGQGALLFSSTLADTGNERLLVTSGDGLWYAREDIAYKQKMSVTSQYLSESSVKYNADDADDWTGENYSPASMGWANAVVVGEDEADPGYPGDAPWNTLRERSIPMLKDYGLVTVSPDECEAEADGSSTIYTLTLPYNMQITPYIELGSSTSTGKKVEMYTETYDLSQLETTYVTDSGAQSYESTCWISGDYLYFDVPSGVEVTAFGYRQTGYYIESGEDSDFAGSFDSTVDESDSSVSCFTGGRNYSADDVSADNNFYDELWNKSVNTLYVCMRDTYMDCPDRERGQYIGDAVNEIEEAFYALGPTTNDLSAKAVRDICEGQVEYEYNGETHYGMSCIEPCMDMHEIQVQELSTALGAWDYYLFSGDESISDCYKALYNYLTNYDYETSGEYSGTIRMRSSEELYQSYHQQVTSSLCDWTDWGDNQDLRIAINCWWYESAVCVRDLAELEGSGATDSEIAWLDGNIAKVAENFDKFWNDDLNAYATEYSSDEWRSTNELDDNSHLVDDRVNAMAVVFGLADESRYQAIRNVFMGTDTAPAYENASIYMEKYVLEALYMMGYDEDAMYRMAERQMLDVNDAESSTMPEYFTVEGETNTGTKNHGWSASAITLLSRYAAGISPTSGGYSSWQVCPEIGNFTDLSVTVPAEIGDIQVSISVNGNTTEMTVVSPGGDLSVYVPVQSESANLSKASGLTNQGIVEINGSYYILLETSASGTYTIVAQ